MVKCLPGILVLTAGMDHLWRRSGYLNSVLRIFLWMSSWHHQGRRQTRDLWLHMAQRLHTDTWLTWVTLTPMFCRETILSLMNMSVFHQIAMFIGLRTFLLIHMSIIHLLQGYLLGLQSQNSQMLHLDSLLPSHPWKCGGRSRINFLLQEMVSSQQSKASDTIAGDLKHIKDAW